MTKEETKEDLECLKIILQNKYIASEFVPDIPLISRLEALINSANSKSNDQLLDDIFKLHSGFYDIHMGYKLNNSKKRFKSLSTAIVKSPTDYQFETLIKRKDHLYFRPKDLSNVLSVEQDELVRFLKSNDVNLVLDLRGNNGGDNEFAFELVRTLFTKDQHVPITTKFQLESTFKTIGLINTAIEVGFYEGTIETKKLVEEAIQGYSLNDLIPYTIEKEIESIEGERLNPFQSKIILLFDSGCASSCETIIEKLSAHPNAITLGRNSMGALHYSNAIKFQLPNSGILTYIPTLYHQYEDDAKEGVGYAPQYEFDVINLDKVMDLIH